MRTDWRQRHAARGLVEIVGTWVFLLGLLTLASHTDSWLLKGISFVLISARQYALLILMHEAFHGLLFSRLAMNDWVGRWAIAYPMGSFYSISKEKHLAHHRCLGEAHDPDYPFYRLDDKRTLSALLYHFLFTLILKQIRYTFVKRRESPRFLVGRRVSDVALVQGFLFSLFCLAGHWEGYFIFWLLPIVTLSVFWDKCRAFCEHVPGADGKTLTRTFLAGPVERFFFAPFDMNYHAEHHKYPGVPHYHLKLVHASEKCGEIVPSYVGFIQSYVQDRHSENIHVLQQLP